MAGETGDAEWGSAKMAGGMGAAGAGLPEWRAGPEADRRTEDPRSVAPGAAAATRVENNRPNSTRYHPPEPQNSSRSSSPVSTQKPDSLSPRYRVVAAPARATY